MYEYYVISQVRHNIPAIMARAKERCGNSWRKDGEEHNRRKKVVVKFRRVVSAIIYQFRDYTIIIIIITSHFNFTLI